MERKEGNEYDIEKGGDVLYIIKNEEGEKELKIWKEKD